jgi:mono/diheme cytochrome c family protein
VRTLGSITLAIFIGFAVSMAARQAAHEKEPHQHADAAKLQNPVAADAASIESGKKLYAENCADCHGETGKGDGPAAPYAGDPPPSNLADAEWKHGSTDGEIYTVIHDGVEGTGMKDFGKELKPNDIWNIVNYVHTLAPKQ